MQACLARDPAARPTAQQLAQRLRPVEPTIVPAGTLALTSPFEPPEPVPRAPLVRGNRALQWLLVANGALAVVLVILVVLVTGPVPVTRAPAPIAAAGAQPQPASAQVAQVAQIPVGKEVRGLAVTSDGAHVVVQTEEGTRIVDTASRAVSAPIPVGGAFALTPDGSRAYVVANSPLHGGVAVRPGTGEGLALSGNAVVRVDLAAGSVIGSTPLAFPDGLRSTPDVLGVDERGTRLLIEPPAVCQRWT
jgi:hypothetical protein